MGKLNEIIKKQGGFNLMWQYLKNGVFFTAIGELILLGKSRTSLEILRLAVQQKNKQKLYKKYYKELIKFDEEYVEDKNIVSNKVWICWFQGMENAPNIVKKCYESIKTNLKDKEIIVITKENLNDYVTFPDYIINKWDEGKITNTHMTDLLRLELLIKYGGLWLDATVFCTDNNIPEYIFNSDLFFYQNLKPGRDGHSIYISSWLMSSKTNNKILLAARKLCYKYWEKNNSLCDYFLLHNFITIVLEYYEKDWRNIVPVSNSTPHILLLRLFEEYDENIWTEVKKQTIFHKLSYKFDVEKTKIENTYYKRILEGNENENS